MAEILFPLIKRSEVGEPSTLTTTQKSSIVGAINELDGEVGVLSGLTTTAKNNLVSSINEVAGKIDGALDYLYDYTASDVYGVEVDFVNKVFKRLNGAIGKTPGASFNSITAFGGRRRCSLTDNGIPVAYYGETGYSETGALTAQIIKDSITYPIGTPVQVMVEQPKFYYKVVPLTLEKIADYAEVNTFKVGAPCTTSGNITITLNGVVFTVSVVAGDAINDVASKIRLATYIGWTATGATDSVIFTCNTTGVRTTGTFTANGTGVTAAVTKNISGGISSGYHLRKVRYYVSDFPKAGFKIHPAFIRNGIEKSKIYLPAYEGSIYDVSASVYLLGDEQIADFTATTGDKIASIAGAKPMSGLTQDLTRAKTRILATNRGSGWQQKDVLSAAASQLLMIIEYAAMDMQTAIALGVVNKQSGTGNESEITGATATLGNTSGVATGTNGQVSISYRGEENFWGNIWKWVDGLNIELGSGVHLAWYTDNGFVDDIKTTPYKNAGFTLSKTNGYISAIGWSETCDFLFLPSETLGGTNLPVGDYFYQGHASTGWRVARLGGYWINGSAAGSFCWYVTDASSNRVRAVGGAAVYVPVV